MVAGTPPGVARDVPPGVARDVPPGVARDVPPGVAPVAAGEGSVSGTLAPIVVVGG